MTAAVEVTDAVGSGVESGWLADLVAGVIRAEQSTLAVHIMLVDDATIRELNRRFHGTDAPTDVLSFPLSDTEPGADEAWDPEAEGPEGEVVVSVDTARREAASRGAAVQAELALYVIHGVLHLLGFDDRDETDRERMRAAEARHLEAAGLPRGLFLAGPRTAGDVGDEA
jgi:probable rRNA maturation factor